MDTMNLASLYGLPALEWSAVQARLDRGVSQAPGTGGPDRHTCWLTTLNEDGSPHITGIGALWVDGTFWFETGERTVKGRNLTRDPRCALSVATDEFDLTVEGEARSQTDPGTVTAMAARWAAEGWPARVDDSGRALTAEYRRAVRRKATLDGVPRHDPSGHRPRYSRAGGCHPMVVSPLAVTTTIGSPHRS